MTNSRILTRHAYQRMHKRSVSFHMPLCLMLAAFVGMLAGHGFLLSFAV